MTWLQGRTVRFHLSPEGKMALEGKFQKDAILGRVEVVDDLGVWIVVGRPASGQPLSLMLLKWDYFSTAVVEIEPLQETPKSRIGFTS